MFPPRFRRFLEDLVEAADVVLAYEAPPAEGAREVREMAAPDRPDGDRTAERQTRDRHALRRERAPRRRERRAGSAPVPEAACVAER